MNEEICIGITETLDILEHMEDYYIKKIPKKFLRFLSKNKSKNYISNLDHTKRVDEMELHEKTKVILAMIYMRYWCSPEEKTEYAKILNDNEKKFRKEMRKKYNPNNIFNNEN